jgi:hypothetical protein
VGTDTLWDAVQAASDIVPWIVSSNTCGPDQRDFAPELELGGSVAYWASTQHSVPPEWACNPKNVRIDGHGPLDVFAIAGAFDAATDLVLGRGTSRLSPVDVALQVLADVAIAREASKVPIDANNAEARDVVRECAALADLGEWFAHKLRGATALAVYEQSGQVEWLDAARSETRAASSAYIALAADTAYIAPFADPMRMGKLGLLNFHWKDQLPRLPLDMASIDESAASVQSAPPSYHGNLPEPSTWLDTPRAEGPGLETITVTPMDPDAPEWTFHFRLGAAPPESASVNLLYRPFDSNAADWVATAATGGGRDWQATVPGTHNGVIYAVEIEGAPGHAYRYPDVTVETPYRVLAP